MDDVSISKSTAMRLSCYKKFCIRCPVAIEQHSINVMGILMLCKFKMNKLCTSNV